jgi:hypothetical protein
VSKVYVKRGVDGNIVAASEVADANHAEAIESDDPVLQDFLVALGGDAVALGDTDQDFIRVLEDVVELLITKGIILFTELPGSAQEKILQRQRLRSKLSEALDLLESE